MLTFYYRGPLETNMVNVSSLSANSLVKADIDQKLIVEINNNQYTKKNKGPMLT